MALKILKIQFGTYKGGKFHARKKSLRNPSYRKVKKEVQKLQRSGALEGGSMFQKWRKARKVSKKGRRKNASIRKLKKEWSGYGRDWRRSQIRVTKARAKAKRRNSNGTSVVIYQDTDSMGKREWYGYVKLESGSGAGHITKNFGPYKTKAQAMRAGKRLSGGKRRNHRRLR